MSRMSWITKGCRIKGLHTSGIAAALLLTFGGLVGCRSADPHPDPAHLAEVDALVAMRTSSAIHTSQLLKGNPNSGAKPLTGALTLSEAIDRTLTHNLTLVASAENLAIAQAQLAQAGLLQNPTLGQTGSFAFPLYSHAGVTPFDLLVSQVINGFFLRPYKVAVAEAQRFQAGIDLASQAFELSQQCEAKYEELIHTVRNKRLAEKIADSYKRAFDAAQARAKVGMVPQPDVNRARLQYEDARRQIRHLQAQYERGAREMNWLMGISGTPLWQLPEQAMGSATVVENLPREIFVEDLGNRYRLDLLRAELDLKVSEANLKLAKLGMIPEIAVGVDVARDTAKHWTVGPAGFSIQLPIFDTGRVSVILAEAQLRLATKTFAATRGQVGQDIRTAYENLQISGEDLTFYRSQQIPQEEENVNLAEKSFSLGNTDLDSLLNTLREYVTVLQAYEDAIDAHHGNVIALQRAVGLVWDRILSAPLPSTLPATRPTGQPALLP
jgi:cobalt-zinc-cadmium efflux system outer membrane protein